ncbi:MAG: hypothetical protein WCG92_19370 [Hyphomicrobiales bacterium]|nr:hypothetical protein [Alphaproteobacteria bacterium]
MPSADHYRAKAAECRDWASKALTQQERDDWIKLASEWEAMAMEANPSGHLPWDVKSV